MYLFINIIIIIWYIYICIYVLIYLFIRHLSGEKERYVIVCGRKGK